METTRRIRLNGKPFRLFQWGDPNKPVLLMLHGFPEYGGAWADVAPLLADRFFCVAPDQRGYGQSWSPPEVAEYTISKLVGDMFEVIDQFGGRATVIGHDWGAAVAYGLAMFAPQKVDRLIVANGVHPVPFQRSLAAGGAQTAASQYITHLRRPNAAQALAENGFAKLMDLFSAKMDLSWLTGDRLKTYQAAWRDAEQIDTMLNWYRASPLKVAKPGQPITDLPEWPIDRLQVRCPHLLLWGADDTALLPEATDGLEQFAHDLIRVVITGADHWVLHQKSTEVSDAILSWLDGKL